MKKIEFFRHCIDEKDIERASAVLRSIFLTTGAEVNEFEQKLAAYTGQSRAIGLTSCTAALHLSLIALNIGSGDEVITTPMSFCATANAVLHAGATPVFVDVEKETGNLNAELVEAAITERTKAIIPVHLYGQMCDMVKLRAIADKYRLRIIEDAAHAIEASRDGISVGQYADAACFSFYATKNITSGEGGAVITGSDMLADALQMLRQHGIDRGAADRYTRRYEHWDMPLLGWKYNMDNIQAALLLGQLGRIDELWHQRDAAWKRYEDALADIKNVSWMKTLEGVRHARHLFTVLVPSQKRDQLLWALPQRGIGVAVNYRPIHLLKYYRENFRFKEGDFPVAEEIGSRTMSLPLYPYLSHEELAYVVQVLNEELNR